MSVPNMPSRDFGARIPLGLDAIQFGVGRGIIWFLPDLAGARRYPAECVVLPSSRR
jgi:hypothetical protein